jgi:hypothetical protein
VITTIRARLNAAAAASTPFVNGRFCAFFRWLRLPRGVCPIITPLMVGRVGARRSDTAVGQARPRKGLTGGDGLCRRRRLGAGRQ